MRSESVAASAGKAMLDNTPINDEPNKPATFFRHERRMPACCEFVILGSPNKLEFKFAGMICEAILLLLPEMSAIIAFPRGLILICRSAKIVRSGTDSYNDAMPDFNLTHHFLIAMPAMQEGVFAGTLTYVCEHNENGALGIVVNRPLRLTLGEMFDQINIPLHQNKLVKMPVHFGGPAQNARAS